MRIACAYQPTLWAVSVPPTIPISLHVCHFSNSSAATAVLVWLVCFLSGGSTGPGYSICMQCSVLLVHLPCRCSIWPATLSCCFHCAGCSTSLPHLMLHRTCGCYSFIASFLLHLHVLISCFGWFVEAVARVHSDAGPCVLPQFSVLLHSVPAFNCSHEFIQCSCSAQVVVSLLPGPCYG